MISHADTWTDHEGNTHERVPGAREFTLCGLNAGESNPVIFARPCGLCVGERLRRDEESPDTESALVALA